MRNIIEEEQSLGELNATIGSNNDLKHFHVPVAESSVIVERSSSSESSIPYTSVEDADSESVIVSTHELPAPYGCRFKCYR